MKEREMNNELSEISKGIFDTFINRRDAFAFQLDDGRYFATHREITIQHVMGHLKGNLTLGVYLLDADNAAKLSVIDADDEDGFEKLLKAHESLPLPSYLETSRRGGHLWFFFEEPVEGKVAKNFGLEIAKRFLIEAEVFPKQAESEGPGSCIRLPFGVHKKTGERYPFVGLGNWRQQLEALTHPVKISLEDVMKYQYQEPERKSVQIYPATSEAGDLPLWEQVKRQIAVEELVSQYVELNAKGIGKCPFHDDVNPSFSVNAKANYWNCFSGCGGGSVIDFWMKRNDMDFKEATKDLAERLGLK
jgi:hypothetical protein